jgi:hypothetical protein
MAEEAGYTVLIIDSLTHEWNGKGGVLELVDEFKAASKSQNAYTEGWSKMTPWHRKLVEKILTTPLHIITTMRSSMDYVLVDGTPKKVGMGAEQRKGMDYEFSIVLDMFQRAKAKVEKTRCSALGDETWNEPGADIAAVILNWMQSGEAENYEAEVQARIAELTQAQAIPAQETPAPTMRTYLDLVNELVKAKTYTSRKDIDRAMANKGLTYAPEQHDELVKALSNGR